MADGVRGLVSRLPMSAFDRLSKRSSVPLSLSREERIARLLVHYSEAGERLLDVLRSEDLLDALASLQIPLGDRYVELVHLSGAPKSALQQSARAIFVDGWLPTAEREGPAYPVSTRFVDRVEADDREAAPVTNATSSDCVGDGRLPVFEQIVGRSAPEAGALQPFQLDAIRRLHEHFISHERRTSPMARRGILCLPTGGGKTRTALEFLLRHFIGRQRVLWIAHRRELLDQVHHELRSLGAKQRDGTSFSISRFQGVDRDLRGDVVIASNATLLQQRPSRDVLDSSSMPLGIVVFDEGHHAIAEQTWRYLEQLVGGDVHLLSLTATPFRSERGGTEKLHALLGDIVHEQSFLELVREGFLAEPEFLRLVLRSTAAFSLSEMEQKALEHSDDFSAETLRRIAGTAGRDEEIVKHWQEQRHRFGKTIAFGCDIEHAEQLTRRFADVVPSKVIHSGLSRDERRQHLQWFREQTQPCVLVNVGILTEGTNIPDVRCVLVARPTMSKALFLQMIGRGSRGPKTVPGKKHFTVIDCVDGYEHLGVPLASAHLVEEFRRDVALDMDGKGDVYVMSVRPTYGASKAVTKSTQSEMTEADVWIASLAETYAWHRDAGRAIDDLVPIEELSCRTEDGLISVPLFDAMLPAVATSLDVLQTAISLQRWTDAHERRSSLDAFGAIRPSQWNRIVAYAQASGAVPARWGVRAFAEHTSLVAKRAVEPLLALLNRCEAIAENARRSEIEAARVAHPGLAVFAGVSALDAALVALLEDRRARVPTVDQRVAAVPSSSRGAEAFVVLAGAVARADGAWVEAEYSVTSKALEQQFQQSMSTRFDSIDSVASDEAAIGAAQRELVSALTWDERSVLFDWLCRVAIADDQLHREEERVLLAHGAALGLSKDDVDRRIGWTLDRDPNSVGARADGRIVCGVCSSVMLADTDFCGTCGASLYGRSIDDSSCPCPACGTRMPPDSKFCGVCCALMHPLPVVSVMDSRSGTQPDWAAGTRAEEFVMSLIAPLIERKSAIVRQRVRAPVAGEEQPGETDIEITRARAPDAGDRQSWDLHVEVKHLKSPSTGAVYWSQREVEKAKRLREQRVAYYVVIAVPRDDAKRFDLYWSTDPIEDLLRDTARSLIRTDTHSVDLTVSDGWRVDKAMPGPSTSACRFQIRLGRGGLQRWSHDSETQIALVEAWFDEQERRAVRF